MVIFRDGHAVPVSHVELLAWCHDGTSWLSFMRSILHDDYAAEMTMHVPKRQPTDIKVIDIEDYGREATFEEPYKGRKAKPAS